MKCAWAFLVSTSVSFLLAFCGSAQSGNSAVRSFELNGKTVNAVVKNGNPVALFGSVLADGAGPMQCAGNFIERYGHLIGQDVGEFVWAERVQPIALDRASGNHRFQLVSTSQSRRGVPVFRSRLGLLLRNEPGFPVVLAGWSVRELHDFEPNLQIPHGKLLTESMVVHMVRRFGRGDFTINSVERVIFAGSDENSVEPCDAVTFIVKAGASSDSRELRYRMVCDLYTGEILFEENQVCELFSDIVGNVSGNATGGWKLGDCNPQSSFALPYGEVRVVGGNSTNADVSGDFVIPHVGDAEVTIESLLRSPWFTVVDLSNGGQTPYLSMQVIPPGPANFLHNASNNSEFDRANVDAYLHANLIRDFTLFHVPDFPEIGTQTGFELRTSFNGQCGAHYNGDSITFYRSGSLCSNTANSTVVYHEYGHHLVAVTGNGQDQFGEGVGDTMAVLITDQPIIGAGFIECETGIRTAENDIQYPCNGIHECAGLISGAVWDTRNELIITEPDDYRRILSELFLNMLIVRGGTQGENGTQITPFITLVLLTLDDDDGDLTNGTPHYAEIATGFGAHNLDAPEISSTELTEFTVDVGTLLSGGIGDLISSDDAYLVTRSGYGSSLSDLHKMEIRISALTTRKVPSLIHLRLESRIDQAAGFATVFLRDVQTTHFDPVASHPLGMTDETVDVNGIAATDYVDVNGSLELLIRHDVFVPFFAFHFDSFLDQVRMVVE